MLGLHRPRQPKGIRGVVGLLATSLEDGGHLARGFRKLATAELATADGAELTLDVYDMRVAANTESIFEKELSPAAKPVEGWPEAVTGSMSFVFRRGRYYVKLTAFDAKAEALLPKVAAALKEAMP